MGSGFAIRAPKRIQGKPAFGWLFLRREEA
jgi:hypothetical protein